MFPLNSVDDITHVIQLAIAPVFLLTAVGTLIGVLANRLARIVDRVRVLEERRPLLEPEKLPSVHSELASLDRRLRLIYIAVASAVFCALFVGLLIAVAFIDAFVRADLAKLVGALFVLAMIAFIGALVVSLREIFLTMSSSHATRREMQ